MESLVPPPVRVLVLGEVEITLQTIDALPNEVRVEHNPTVTDPGSVCGEFHAVLVGYNLSRDDVSTFLECVADECPSMPGFCLEEDILDRAGEAGLLWTYVPERTFDQLPDRLYTAARAYRDATTKYPPEEMLELLQRHSEVNIAFLDDEGRHRWITHQELPPTEEVLGATAEAVFPEPVGSQLHQENMEILETGEPVVAKEVHHETDLWGETWERRSKYPWTADDGSVKGLLEITQNVSAERRREQQLQRQMERLDEFATVVAHDLRNPLNVATARLDIAATERDDEDLQAAVDALAHIEQLVEDLLAMARHGETVEETSEVSLADAARRAWEHVDTSGSTLQIERFDYEFLADQERLQRLLENLFRNAVQHGSEGGVANPGGVTVTVGTAQGGFYVEDDGPGIPEADRDQLFEHGFTTSEDGTGFGMSIVQSIAQAHGWSVAVEEGREGGARIRISGVEEVGESPTQQLADDEPGPVRTVPIEDSADVGDVGVAGSTSAGPGEGSYRLEGEGANMWGNTVEFHFAHAEVSGDLTVVGQVADIDGDHYQAKGGLIVRQSLDPADPQIYVGAKAGGGHEILVASEPGAITRAVPYDDEARPPCYYRLQRRGDEITASVSVAGDEWDVIDTETVPMTDPVLAGLAVCSHRAHDPVTVQFEDVSIEVPEADDEERVAAASGASRSDSSPSNRSRQD